MRHVDASLGKSVMLAVLGLLLPALTLGQGTTNGAIAGVVRDTSGAVLPGVTVEAASPALIEKVRSGVTNEQGQYQIQDLRPGVYTVTFTLAGFRPLRREGVALTAAFTGNINAELSVGGVEESVTVSGQPPIVDVRTTAKLQSFTADVINSLPTAKEFSNLAVLIPGMTQSVAGSANTQDVGGTTAFRNPTLSIHGSRTADMPQSVDGLRVEIPTGTGAGLGGWVANAGIVEEVLIETSGQSAEAETSGVQVNYVPRQGGNTFSGSFYGAYTNNSLQADNLTPALIARGGSKVATERILDVNPSFGGPLRRDKVWFYYSFRSEGAITQPPGAYYNTNPTAFVYIPDRSRPANIDLWHVGNDGRITWQVSTKHKFAFYGSDLTPSCICRQFLSATVAPETAPERVSHGTYLLALTWNWVVSPKFLIEAGTLIRHEDYDWTYPLAAPDGIGVSDNGTGIIYRAPAPALAGITNFRQTSQPVMRGKLAASYVTGSHNLKVGSQWLSAGFTQTNYGDTQYTFTSGMPTGITLTGNGPGTQNVKLSLGIYAQDSWTHKRLTLNLGGRFDSLNAYLPAQHLPASKWMGARDFPAQDDLPNWKDFSPRLGISYDVFGTGRTAIKFSVGRFVEAMATGIAQAVTPALTAANGATTRAWTDNGDLIPQESELGPSSNLNFGTSFVATRYAPGLTTGWGKRGANWETSVGLQQEVLGGVSVNAGYYRRSYDNFRLTDNVLVTPADYDQYCVTAPVDPRLPGGGGNQICGLYNLKSTSFGVSDNVITAASNFGTETEIFDGVDVSVTARLPGKVTFMGGTSTGRVRYNRCFVVDSPQDLAFPLVPVNGAAPTLQKGCATTPPFLTQVKLSGVYPLPWWGVQTSAIYQNLAGPQITADWAAPASAVTGLGRPLAGGARTVLVPLVAPGTLYGDRLHQVDLRVSKRFTLGTRVKVEGQFDLYNLFNGNAVIAQNNTFGAAWQRPTAILEPRLAKFGVLLQF